MTGPAGAVAFGGFARGDRLGPYEIVAALGAGGMGVVYRARDTRLGRDVAAKVLPARLAADPARLRRFELEARAVAALNHPNILALYDVGTHAGTPYLVTELLDGETLRERLRRGALPVRRAVEIGVGIAHGLAAAHEKGVLHRDLKPGNVFVTKDGRVKILDFGVAKLTQPEPDPYGTAPPPEPSTEAGAVPGTAGYVAPEQVRGQPADRRSDIFALGCVLYEMLGGTAPFRRETTADTVAAILHEEPPELVRPGLAVSPGLERVVRRCLEKEASQRFESAHDVAFALEVASADTGMSATPAQAGRPMRSWRLIAGALLGLGLVVISLAGFFAWGKVAGRAPVPSYKRIALRNGSGWGARFTPDLQSVVYGGRWEGKSDLFVQRLASTDVRRLEAGPAYVVCTTGADVLIQRASTLARMPLEGGTPRDLLKGIGDATVDAAGNPLALVRFVGGRQRLEFPVGNVILETKGLETVGSLAISRDGTLLAYAFQPTGATDMVTEVCVADRSGRKRSLSAGWKSWGARCCWSPDGSEVWFSASRREWADEIHAVSLTGRERLVARIPGSAVIWDVAPDGRVLMAVGEGMGFELRGRMAGDEAERDLSWLDGTAWPMLSPDGTRVVFIEQGEGGGAGGSAYYRRMDGSMPVRLGQGGPLCVSPDWTTVLVGVGSGPGAELRLVPIGAGETVTLPRGPLRAFSRAAWHPDGRRIVIHGTDASGQRLLFVQDTGGGPPQVIEKAEAAGPLTPDGRYVAATAGEGEPFTLIPIDGGERRPIPFLKAGETPIMFAEDGGSLYLTGSQNFARFPVRVERLDLKTGERTTWLQLAPPDGPGVGGLFGLRLTPNGRFYAYGFIRALWRLYLVEGLQ